MYWVNFVLDHQGLLIVYIYIIGKQYKIIIMIKRDCII